MLKRSIPAVLLAFASLLAGAAGHAETSSAIGDGPSSVVEVPR